MSIEQEHKAVGPIREKALSALAEYSNLVLTFQGRASGVDETEYLLRKITEDLATVQGLHKEKVDLAIQKIAGKSIKPTVLSPYTPLSEPITVRDLTLNPLQGTVRKRLEDKDQQISLPRQETIILYTLMRFPGQTVPKEFLLEELAKGSPSSQSLESMRVQVSNLRKKLRDTKPPTYIVSINGTGYTFPLEVDY